MPSALARGECRKRFQTASIDSWMAPHRDVARHVQIYNQPVYHYTSEDWKK